jgi:hypothetical protein
MKQTAENDDDFLKPADLGMKTTGNEADNSLFDHH